MGVHVGPEYAPNPNIQDNRLQSKKLISSWLKECWCDAYGIKCGGLAFLYAQLHDFMFCFPNYLSSAFIPGQSYPLASFRLKIAHILALERLKYPTEVVKKLINEYEQEEKLFIEIAGVSTELDPFKEEIAYLSNYFIFFLKSKFFVDDHQLIGELDKTNLQLLMNDLSNGLPIPSIKSTHEPQERATKTSEIILSGWRHRNEVIRKDLIKLFNSCSIKSDNNDDKLNKKCNKLIEKISQTSDRADECIKRSIQVAEWFETLSPEKNELKAETNSDDEVLHKGLLVDKQIKKLLLSQKLRIVPLINIVDQLHGSSIDLRLGHNFEIFHHGKSGVIDPCGGANDYDLDSIQLEIDAFDGVTIIPGQFMLSHSLEYIKLPNDIAAQIEGRSSFARLGIQVHMTANLVETGFEGCLTLEISNSGSSSVKLYPGMRIAQLRFVQLSNAPEISYNSKKAKYRGQLSHNKAKQFSDREVDIYKDKIRTKNE